MAKKGAFLDGLHLLYNFSEIETPFVWSDDDTETL